MKVKDREASKGASCWNCYYKKGRQMSVFGECTYFTKLGKQPKEIPSDIANKGCQYFLDKEEHNPIVQEILTLFDGEIISDEPYNKNSFKKERKYKNNKEKYSKRADWD